MPKPTESLLQLLLLVVAPPPDVLFAVQRGQSELLAPFAEGDGSIAFAVTLRVQSRPDGSFNFLGPYAQGTPDDRFVYLNAGIRAGQLGTPWERRAKIKLTGIPHALGESAIDRTDRAVEARIAGTARDGGPVCATVKPPDIAWRLTSSDSHLQ